MWSKEKQLHKLVWCRVAMAKLSEPLTLCSLKVTVIKGTSLCLEELCISHEEL